MTNCCGRGLHANFQKIRYLTLIDVAHWRTWQLVGYANPKMVTRSNRRMLMLARGYLNTCQDGWRIVKLTREVCFTAASDLSQLHNQITYRTDHGIEVQIKTDVSFFYPVCVCGNKFGGCYKNIHESVCCSDENNNPTSSKSSNRGSDEGGRLEMKRWVEM